MKYISLSSIAKVGEDDELINLSHVRLKTESKKEINRTCDDIKLALTSYIKGTGKEVSYDYLGFNKRYYSLIVPHWVSSLECEVIGKKLEIPVYRTVVEESRWVEYNHMAFGTTRTPRVDYKFIELEKMYSNKEL